MIRFDELPEICRADLLKNKALAAIYHPGVTDEFDIEAVHMVFTSDPSDLIDGSFDGYAKAMAELGYIQVEFRGVAQG